MKQLTDEVFAQVREALRPFAEDAKYIHKDWSDERMRASLTQNTPLTVRHFRKASEALAALDTAQSVQPVGHISTKLGAFVQEGSWIGPLPVNKLFYAVSDRYSAAAAPQPKETK